MTASRDCGRRNRIDTLLVCRVPEPSDDETPVDEPSTTGATRYEAPAVVES